MTDEPITEPADTPGGETLVSADPLADAQRERDEYHDRWMRKAAEFDNYRKRIERERKEQSDQAVLDLLQQLLLIVDDFDRALTVEAGRGRGLPPRRRTDPHEVARYAVEIQRAPD